MPGIRTRRLARAALLAALPALAGCQAPFAPTRVDATPFAEADDECWDYAAIVAPDEGHPAMYAKCMARHGWASCGAAGPCRPGPV
jgi:hypothetical protein